MSYFKLKLFDLDSLHQSQGFVEPDFNSQSLPIKFQIPPKFMQLESSE